MTSGIPTVSFVLRSALEINEERYVIFKTDDRLGRRFSEFPVRPILFLVGKTALKDRQFAEGVGVSILYLDEYAPEDKDRHASEEVIGSQWVVPEKRVDIAHVRQVGDSGLSDASPPECLYKGLRKSLDHCRRIHGQLRLEGEIGLGLDLAVQLLFEHVL